MIHDRAVGVVLGMIQGDRASKGSLPIMRWRFCVSWNSYGLLLDLGTRHCFAVFTVAEPQRATRIKRSREYKVSKEELWGRFEYIPIGIALGATHLVMELIPAGCRSSLHLILAFDRTTNELHAISKLFIYYLDTHMNVNKQALGKAWIARQKQKPVIAREPGRDRTYINQ